MGAWIDRRAVNIILGTIPNSLHITSSRSKTHKESWPTSGLAVPLEIVCFMAAWSTAFLVIADSNISFLYRLAAIASSCSCAPVAFQWTPEQVSVADGWKEWAGTVWFTCTLPLLPGMAPMARRNPYMTDCDT